MVESLPTIYMKKKNEDTDNEYKYQVEQVVEVTFNETTAKFRINRELPNTYINYLYPYVENYPFLEDGKLRWDLDVSVLSNLFDYDMNMSIDDLDKLIFNLGIGESDKITCTYVYFEDNDNLEEVYTNYDFDVKLLQNDLFKVTT